MIYAYKHYGYAGTQKLGLCLSKFTVPYVIFLQMTKKDALMLK